MIFDSYLNLRKYANLNRSFKIAADFVENGNIRRLKPGKYILNKGIYASVTEYKLQSINDKFIECHKKYLDIHIALKGEERIGICNKINCRVLEKYNREKDFEKLKGNMDFITLRKDLMAVFYPEDGHMPGIKSKENGKNEIKKLVIKIPINLL